MNKLLNFQLPARTGTALWIAMLLIPVILFFLINQKVPLFADDLCRTQSHFSFSSAFKSAYSAYFSFSGRYPVMVLNQLFFSGGAPGIVILEVLNSCFLFAAGILVLNLFDKRLNNVSIIGLLGFFWFLLWFTPNWLGEAMLWKTGTIQYFWGSVIALACLLPVIKFVVWKTNFEIKRYLVPILLFGAFLGGAWLEHISTAIVGVWIGLLLYVKLVQRREIPKVFLYAMVCWCLGFIMLVAAPGNYERASLISSDVGVVDRIVRIANLFFDWFDKKLFAVYVLFLVIAIVNRSSEIHKRLFQSFILFSVAALAAFATVGAPKVVFGGRVVFPSEFFLIFSVLSVFPVTLFNAQMQEVKHILQRWAILLISITLFAIFIVDAKNIYTLYDGVWSQNVKRIELAHSKHRVGEAVIELPPLYYGRHSTRGGDLNYGRLFARDIRKDSSYFTNRCFSKVYKVGKVLIR